MDDNNNNIFCQKCGKKNPYGSKRCQDCGEEIFYPIKSNSGNSGKIFCKKCGAPNELGTKICKKCGCALNTHSSSSGISQNKNDDVVKCPRCGSTQVEFVNKTHTQGVSGSNACCGWLLIGPIGLLCGLCGAGNSSSRAVRKCKKCGKEF